MRNLLILAHFRKREFIRRLLGRRFMGRGYSIYVWLLYLRSDYRKTRAQVGRVLQLSTSKL